MLGKGFKMENFKRGDKVIFGRRNGEQTLGEVVKVNPRSLKIRQLEGRGTLKDHSVGTLWNVAKPLARLAEPREANATPEAVKAVSEREAIEEIQKRERRRAAARKAVATRRRRAALAG